MEMIGKKKKARVLIIDDNPNIIELAKYALVDIVRAEESDYEYELAYAYNGIQGLEQIYKIRPDVVIVDVKMPRMDGYQLVRCLRSDPRTAQILLIILSAMTREEDMTTGFLSGCDSYITKPFKPNVLHLQVQAHLHSLERSEQSRSKIVHFADVTLNLLDCTAHRGERELKLTETEYRLLECFLQYPGEVLKRSFLLDQVWGMDSDVESNVVDVYIGYLRKKLEAGGASRLIQTKRGIGYMLKEAYVNREKIVEK